MNRALKFTACGAALAILAGTAQALPIEVIVTNIRDGVVIDTQTDSSNVPGTVAATIVDSSGLGLGFTGDASARAIQTSDGNAAVSVEGIFAGGSPVRTLQAEAVFTETVTNNTGVAQTVNFNFVIAPIVLELERSSRYGVGTPSVALYDIDIALDGAGIFQSGAQLQGLNNFVQLFDDADTNPDATDLGGVVTGPTTETGRTTATFNGFIGAIELGVLDAGEEFELTYRMLAQTSGRETESGGRASIGDPLNFDTTPGIATMFEFLDTDPVPVPEPPTWLMMLVGLTAVGTFRRRRSLHR